MPPTRRTVLGAGIAAAVAPFLPAPLESRAQTAGRPWRIAFLTNGSVASAKYQIDAFVLGLGEHGWVDGRQFVVASHWADGKTDRLPALVAELLGEKPDLIYVPSGLAAKVVKDSGTVLPIVFAFAPDPVGHGFAASLSRPGGNMTGLTSTHHELSAKRIEMLRQLTPTVARIAVLYQLVGPGAGVEEQVAETERAAKSLGLAALPEETKGPDDFERAFASIGRQRAEALIVIENPVFFTNRARMAQWAATLRIPAIYNSSEYVREGGLICYGANYADLSRRAASYAVKILRGTPPGELPIERPTKFELVINAKTAKTIGVTIPHAMLLRADEVIT